MDLFSIGCGAVAHHKADKAGGALIGEAHTLNFSDMMQKKAPCTT